MSTRNKRRFRPIDIAMVILVAGWLPSIFMAALSYRILSEALESKVAIERRIVVEILANVIGNDLTRPATTLDYFATLPQTQEMLRLPYGDPAVQSWMESVKSSRPNNDGIFLTDSSGKLIMSVPLRRETLGKPFSPELWLDQARANEGLYVSAVGNRETDGKLCAFVVLPVRAQDGKISGYFGTTILVARIGARLSAFNFGEGSTVQILDQNGMPIFDDNLAPNVTQKTLDPGLIKLLQRAPAGHFAHGSALYSFHPIERTSWTAILQQPLSIAYAPIHDLVAKTAWLAAWLVAGTALFAWFASRLYRRQIESDNRIARETLFTETILANMPAGIALIKPESNRIIQRNQSWTRMMERFGGLAPGSADREIGLDDISPGFKAMFDKFSQGRSHYEAREKRVRSPSGEYHFISVDLLRLEVAPIGVIGFLMLLTDNTAEIAVREELIAANAAKDQFLALLSHELRNPLSPVITMVAELDHFANESPEMRNALEVIRRNVELEARLIDDLLDLTRITHDKLQLNPEIVDAHQIIRRALEICEPDARAKQLEVKVKLEAARHWVKGDPARLQQTFWNLIKNAIKFTPQGSITIESRSSPAGILTVKIHDTGIGIEASRLEKIFKPFEQGESSIMREYGGLGLGLTISNAMVKAHDGKLSASSPGKNQGSTFTVELGAVEAPANIERNPAAPDPGAANSSRGKILLVDDHEDTCAGMKMLLERRGFEVTTAHTVAGGAIAAAAMNFDLVISDLGLPDGTGFDLMQTLRIKRPGIKGIALSGFGMESDVARSREAGFIEHLIKPVNIDNLAAVLNRVMG